MKENERGGLTTPLLMETLEDRNAATSLAKFHLPVHLPVLQAHTHHHSAPAHSHNSHSHGWAFAWGHSGHGHGGCGGHNQSPPPASPPPASPPPAVTPSVSGVVFEDYNHDGIHDEGEPTVAAGREVRVDTNGDGVFDQSTTTAADGSYKLTGLPTGVQLTIQSVNDNGEVSPPVSVSIPAEGNQQVTKDVGLFVPPS